MFKSNIKVYIEKEGSIKKVSEFSNIFTAKGLTFAARGGIGNVLSLGTGRAEVNLNTPSLANKAKELAGVWRITKQPSVNIETNTTSREDTLDVRFPTETTNIVYTELGISSGSDLLTYAHTTNAVGEVAGITVLAGENLLIEYSIETTVPYLETEGSINQPVIIKNTGPLGTVPNNIDNSSSITVKALSSINEQDILIGLDSWTFVNNVSALLKKNNEKITVYINNHTNLPQDGQEIKGFLIDGHYKMIVPIIEGKTILNNTEYNVSFNINFRGI